MPYLECSGCGHGFATRAGDVACPECGAVHEVEARLAWRKRVLPWGLAAALVPLLVLVLFGGGDTAERLERAIRENPEIARNSESVEEFIGRLPGERLEGATHPRATWIHWLYAAISAVAFWLFLLIAYPMGKANSKHLWALGLFTGTIGILLLVALQFVAAWSQGLGVGGGGVMVLLFLLIRIIGFSYAAAEDPDNGFFASFAGYTVGVGLCEELVKALPLIWALRRGAQLDVRGVIVWGLATGIGFGVSEGIHYSARYYNGLQGFGIYVVRFVSCVSLHAVWSAAVGLFLLRFKDEIEKGDDAWEALLHMALPVLTALGISMVLHGLYDTLLKKELEFPAFVIALGSFVWFFWLSERARRREDDAALAGVQST